MGDQDQTFLFFSVDLFKSADQHGKAPEIDPCLRLIKNADLMRLCKNRSDFQPLHFTTGKRSVQLAVSDNHLNRDRQLKEAGSSRPRKVPLPAARDSILVTVIPLKRGGC